MEGNTAAQLSVHESKQATFPHSSSWLLHLIHESHESPHTSGQEPLSLFASSTSFLFTFSMLSVFKVSVLLLSVHVSLSFLPSFLLPSLSFPFCLLHFFLSSLHLFIPTLHSLLTLSLPLPHRDRIVPPLEQLPRPQVTSFNQELPLDVAKQLNGQWSR